MEQRIEWTPAFDRRHADDSKNYGIGSMSIKFLLKGELGTVQFYILSGWYLRHVRKEYKNHPGFADPMGADVGYHSPKPIYDNQSPSEDSCLYLDGKPCYYDGSGLAADDLFNKFIAEGIDVVWNELEEYYASIFGELR